MGDRESVPAAPVAATRVGHLGDRRYRVGIHASSAGHHQAIGGIEARDRYRAGLLDTATWVAVWVSLINLTPGTLTVEISDDLDEAWVHSLYAGDPAELKDELRALQDRVSHAFVMPLAPAAGGVR